MSGVVSSKYAANERSEEIFLDMGKITRETKPTSC